MKRVFIIDDDPLFCKLLTRAVLEVNKDTEIHEFHSMEDAIKEVRSKPDIVFTDHFLPGANGLETLPELRAQLPKSRLVIISSHTKVSSAVRAFRDGADDYFVKDSNLISHVKTFLNEIVIKGSTAISGWKKVLGSEDQTANPEKS